MFYVYVLKSKKDGKFYIGFTSDLRLRFQEHNAGKVDSTSYRRPLELIYYESYKKEETAKKREKQLKNGKVHMALIKRLKERWRVDKFFKKTKIKFDIVLILFSVDPSPFGNAR